MILINIKMSIRPDKMDEWLLLADSYAKDVNSEDGCLFFQFARSLTDKSKFICIEGFKDAEAGANHVKQWHLSRCVSADGVDQRLPCPSQWGWQDEVRPQVHQQCAVDVVADVLAGPLAQDDLVYPRALAPVGQVVLPSRL